MMTCLFVFSFTCLAQVKTVKTTVKPGTVIPDKVKITDDAPAPDKNASVKVKAGNGVTVTDDAPAPGNDKNAMGVKAHDDGGPTPGGDKIVTGQKGPEGQVLYQGVNGTKYYFNAKGGKIFLPSGK